jgi:CRP-like cAMP-binding protein
VEVLQPLGADRLRQLATVVVDQVRAGGEQVVRQGETSSTLYVIDTGAAEVRLRNGSGEETALAKLGPGDFFGEMSLLTGQSCSATVVMLSEGRLLEIEKGMLQAFVDAEPQLAERFGGVLSRRQAERSAAAAATGGEENEEKAILAKVLDFFGL